MNGGELINDLQLVPFHPWWQRPTAVACIILACLIALTGLYLYNRRLKRTPVPVRNPEPTIDWEAEFRRRLLELRNRSIHLSGYELAIGVSELLREYFCLSRSWTAPYQTSQELLGVADSANDLGPGRVDQLKNFLGLADRIKFGKHEAVASERAQLLDLAETMIFKATATNPVPATSPSTI